MTSKQHIGILLLRISIAFTMLIYGISKLFYGIEFISDTLIQYRLPSILGYGVFIGEIVAPILIIIGYRTKLAGLIFAVNCLVAIVLFRLPNMLELNEFGGWAIGPIFIYTIFGVALFFMGAGNYALSTQNKWD